MTAQIPTAGPDQAGNPAEVDPAAAGAPADDSGAPVPPPVQLGMESVRRVLDHSGFFQAETVKESGSPFSQRGVVPCERFRVGVSLRQGIVSWYEADTWEQAFAEAATAIKAPPHAYEASERAAMRGGPCMRCGVERFAHEWPLVEP